MIKIRSCFCLIMFLIVAFTLPFTTLSADPGTDSKAADEKTVSAEDDTGGESDLSEPTAELANSSTYTDDRLPGMAGSEKSQGSDGQKPLPDHFELKQNHPNPFNAGTSIKFTVSDYSYVLIEIHNIVGRKVAIVADDFYSTGVHTVTWDGRDFDGNELSSGIYFYNMTAGEYKETRKMAYIK